MLPWLVSACSAEDPRPAPPATTRADAAHARLVDALSRPGVWEGPLGRLEVTADRKLRFAVEDCEFEDGRDIPDVASRSSCRKVEGEAPLIPERVYAHSVSVQLDEPRMPLYAPARIGLDGKLFFGTPWSNFMGIGTIDDAGRGVLRWTPMHLLIVEPGPRCSWEDQVVKATAPVACEALERGEHTLLRFTVPGDGVWSGEHAAVMRPAEGVLSPAELDAAVYTRTTP